MRGLAAGIGTSTETLYGWFRGDAEPSLGHLRALAEALEVRRVELLAVLDGEQPGELPAPARGELAEVLENQNRLIERQVAALEGITSLMAIGLPTEQRESLPPEMQRIVSAAASARRTAKAASAGARATNRAAGSGSSR